MDIDIDVKSSFDPMKTFPNAVRASMIKHDGDLGPHPAGTYFQKISVDPITKLSAIPYKQAEELGYLKIDFLHLSFLDAFEHKSEIRELLKVPPNWKLLANRDVVSKLFQIHKHYDLLQTIGPRSVVELGDCIALIRPGKRYLLDQYLNNREAIRPLLYTKPKDGKVYFKRSHAISYSLTICVQLHLIEAGII